GYRTGYTYRYPFVQEKSKPKSDVLIPATVTAFVFEEEAAPVPALRQHAHKQQKEKTRWLNTPNTYMRVNVAEEQQGSSQRTKTTWLKADEVEKGSSGTPIRIENPNQFVPLYTDPQEVLEMRNKIREQNRQDVKSAGPQSQLLASVIAETRGEVTPARRRGDPLPSPGVGGGGRCHHKDTKALDRPERSPVALWGRGHLCPHPDPLMGVMLLSPRASQHNPPPSCSPRWVSGRGRGQRGVGVCGGGLLASSSCLMVSVCLSPHLPFSSLHPPAVVNGKEEEQNTEESQGKAGDRTTPNADTPKEKETVTSSPVSPEGSPSKSPSKKKKKFRTPSFLKKGKKKEKIES
ncbi:ADDB protein, partial [Atlantisia rogersi]|nr:ADDB protein [Atlantisia rogersi]